MEKDELIREWASKMLSALHEAADSPIPEKSMTVAKKFLSDVFDVGVETGVGEERTRVQLSQHGKPYGFDH